MLVWTERVTQMICKKCKNRHDCKTREAFERLCGFGGEENVRCSGYEPDAIADTYCPFCGAKMDGKGEHK